MILLMKNMNLMILLMKKNEYDDDEVLHNDEKHDYIHNDEAYHDDEVLLQEWIQISKCLNIPPSFDEQWIHNDEVYDDDEVLAQDIIITTKTC